MARCCRTSAWCVWSTPTSCTTASAAAPASASARRPPNTRHAVRSISRRAAPSVSARAQHGGRRCGGPLRRRTRRADRASAATRRMGARLLLGAVRRSVRHAPRSQSRAGKRPPRRRSRSRRSTPACSSASATMRPMPGTAITYVRSVVQDRALADERRVDEVLQHEVGDVGARDLGVDRRAAGRRRSGRRRCAGRCVSHGGQTLIQSRSLLRISASWFSLSRKASRSSARRPFATSLPSALNRFARLAGTHARRRSAGAARRTSASPERWWRLRCVHTWSGTPIFTPSDISTTSCPLTTRSTSVAFGDVANDDVEVRMRLRDRAGRAHERRHVVTEVERLRNEARTGEPGCSEDRQSHRAVSTLYEEEAALCSTNRTTEATTTRRRR